MMNILISRHGWWILFSINGCQGQMNNFHAILFGIWPTKRQI